MGAFLREITRGLFSFEAYPTSAALFDLAFLCFVIATVAYLVYVASRRDAIWRIGFGAGIVAAVAMTKALALRWVAAGWDHPPFTNMYESLVFFVWGIVVVYLVAEWRYRVKIAGAFVLPLAGLAMGLASLSPNKEIEPLVPALQSIWLHLHVAVASIGYAAFLTAFVFAVLFLLKDKVPLTRFIAVAAGFAVFAILGASRGSLIASGQFLLDQTVEHGHGWTKVPLPDGPEGKFAQIAVPGAGPVLLVALAGYLLAFVAALMAGRRTEARAPRQGLFAAFIVLTLAMGWLVLQVRQMPDARLAANPYALAILVLAWLGSLLIVIFGWRYDELLAALPAASTLDKLGYRAILVGFPLMTLVIVTGAIWANKAWGRPWGWDPKETASLVTWIIYLLYLHTRLTAGWTGRRSNLIAIVGFLSVVFTYLGVNLLLSGLHAYATG
jgi:ABC-type transport system involved in cytochrome c biogenesis permease subunit